MIQSHSELYLTESTELYFDRHKPNKYMQMLSWKGSA